jgi:hypothetical protein
MKEPSPEVLIYIQSVKNFFKNNKDAREYFLSNSDEKSFFKHLTEISQKNFEKNGEVMLSQTQFELLRKTISAIAVVEKSMENTTSDNIFVDIKDFGKICLN